MEQSKAHRLCRREDICVTPAVHASLCSRRLLEDGLFCPSLVGGEGCLLKAAACVCPPTGRLRIYRVIGVTPRTWTNEVILTIVPVCHKISCFYVAINWKLAY